MSATIAAIGSTALAIAQMVSVGKELVTLYQGGTITEDELVARWQANSLELGELEAGWLARQAAKKAAKKKETSA